MYILYVWYIYTFNIEWVKKLKKKRKILSNKVLLSFVPQRPK